MKNKSKEDGISRRSFLNRMGTGIAGAYVLTPAMKTLPKEIQEDAKMISEGKVLLEITVNGKKIKSYIEPNTTLVEFLRNEMQLFGTKLVCNQGECGGCTVLLNNKAVYSCHILALDAAGKEVVTIEGLMKGEELHPIQQAFVDHDGLQCGFCTPGQIMAAQALLIKNPKPSSEQVLEGMSGNICRCSAYPNIMKSVLGAAEKLNK
jgi:xanthine dehydrogenase YagT iron-sulfur-binding subunit